MGDNEDWRRQRAEELGLIDTGPWLGRRDRQVSMARRTPADPERGERDRAVPDRIWPEKPAAPPAAAEPPAPPPVVPKPEVAPQPVPPPVSAKSPPPSATTTVRPAAGAVRPGGIIMRPWMGFAAGAAMLAAATLGWQVRDAAAPPVFTSAAQAPMAQAPAVTGEPAPILPLPETAEAPAPAASAAKVADMAKAAPPAVPAAPGPAAAGLSPEPGIATARTGPTVVGRLAESRMPGPSFSCKRGITDIARMICADGDLAALDREMASRYRALLGRVDKATERRLDDDQSDFLNARSQCGDAQCVEWLYRQRIGELE